MKNSKKNSDLNKVSNVNAQLTLDTIIKNLPGHVYWKDKEGFYLGCNDAQAHSLGLTDASQLIGKTDYDISLSRAKADLFRKNDLEVLQTKKPKVFEEKTVINGNERTVSSQKVPLIHNNESIGIIGISTDLTDIKIAQKTKVKFISLAAHETRTPLSNIIMLLNLVFRALKRDYKIDIKYMDYLKKAIDEGNNGIDSIENLRKLVLIEDKIINSDFVVCNPYDFINKVIKNYKENKKNIQFESYIDKSIKKYIEFDLLHAQEIIGILINNSMKFCNDNGIISIKIELIDEMICFSVKDNGIGISKKNLENLFTSIFSNEQLLKEEYIKPSIKLCYLKNMLDLLNGKMDIQSEKNVGTEIKIFLPFKNTSKNLSEILINESKNDLNMLLVEDNTLTALLTIEEFKNHVGQIEFVDNGEDAIRLVREKEYKLILLDITLGDTNGIELLKEMKKIKLNLNSCYVAYTSNASEDDEKRFIDAGFDLVLFKPINKNDIEECIYELINQSKQT